MDKLKYYILKYANHLKYWLLIVNLFGMIYCTRIFVNYNNIEQAIEETSRQSYEKTQQLWYAKNFQIPYENSEYAKVFIKHENNILLPWEFIIKLENRKEIETGSNNIQWETANQIKILSNPPDARNQFLKERLFSSNTNK